MVQRVSLGLEMQGGRDEELAQTTQQWVAFLRENADGFEVLPGPVTQARPGEKSGTIAVIGTVIVALAKTGALTALLQCVKAFFSRGQRGGVKVSITTEKGRKVTIEADKMTVEDMEKLVE